jgi:hypothetical protein
VVFRAVFLVAMVADLLVCPRFFPWPAVAFRRPVEVFLVFATPMIPSWSGSFVYPLCLLAGKPVAAGFHNGILRR